MRRIPDYDSEQIQRSIPLEIFKHIQKRTIWDPAPWRRTIIIHEFGVRITFRQCALLITCSIPKTRMRYYSPSANSKLSRCSQDHVRFPSSDVKQFQCIHKPSFGVHVKTRNQLENTRYHRPSNPLHIPSIPTPTTSITACKLPYTPTASFPRSSSTSLCNFSRVDRMSLVPSSSPTTDNPSATPSP